MHGLLEGHRYVITPPQAFAIQQGPPHKQYRPAYYRLPYCSVGVFTAFILHHVLILNTLLKAHLECPVLSPLVGAVPLLLMAVSLMPTTVMGTSLTHYPYIFD